jgi:hypothetical protein
MRARSVSAGSSSRSRWQHVKPAASSGFARVQASSKPAARSAAELGAADRRVDRHPPAREREGPLRGLDRQGVDEGGDLDVRGGHLGVVADEDRLAVAQPDVEACGARQGDVAVDPGRDAPVVQPATR